jgi:hypothetical protein
MDVIWQWRGTPRGSRDARRCFERGSKNSTCPFSLPNASSPCIGEDAITFKPLAVV